jgi:hypothetical protein
MNDINGNSVQTRAEKTRKNGNSSFLFTFFKKFVILHFVAGGTDDWGCFFRMIDKLTRMGLSVLVSE